MEIHTPVPRALRARTTVPLPTAVGPARTMSLLIGFRSPALTFYESGDLVLTKAADAASVRDADLIHDRRCALGPNAREALHQIVHTDACKRLVSLRSGDGLLERKLACCELFLEYTTCRTHGRGLHQCSGSLLIR